MSKKIRVAYILGDFATGGLPQWIYTVAKELLDYFDFYFIATHVEHIHERFYQIGIPVFINCPIGSEKEMITDVSHPIYQPLIRYLKENRIEIVQTSNRSAWIACARKANVSVIIERTAGLRSIRKSYEGVDAIISQNRLVIPYINFDSNHIYLVYHGVDFEEFEQLKPERFAFQDTDILIGQASRLGGDQNIALQIKAGIFLNQKYTFVKIIIVGGPNRFPGAPNELPRLKQLAEPLGENVIFTGDMEYPYNVIKGFDIAVCTSNANFTEGAPRKLIEPMAMGIPLVATNPQTSAVSECLEDGVNGFLVADNDLEAFIDALDKLINSKELRILIGENNKKKAKEMFDIKKQAQKVKDIYLKYYYKNRLK